MSENQAPESLRTAADRLLQSAYAYWKELGAAVGSRAVIWLEDADGRVVIFTRGEYRQHLMESIHQRGHELHFMELPPKGDDQ